MSEVHQYLDCIQVDLYLDLVGGIIIALNQKGEITLLNKKGNEVLEYEDGEIIGHNWFDTCIPSRFRAKVFRVFQKIMLGEEKLVEFFENPVLTKNGEEKIIAWHNTIIYDDDMNIVGTLSLGEDITKRKQAEKELKNHQATLESIFVSTPTGISLVIDHVITQVNIRFCTIVGYSQDELLGRSIRVVYPSDEDYRYVERTNDLQIQNHGIATIETRFLRKDGTMIDILLNSAPINPYDLSAGITYTALDITHRKRVEENLKKSEEKYRNAYNRINLYRDVFSHDINNIMQNILTSVELVKLFSGDPNRTQSLEEITNLIYEQVIRGKMLVANIQELSKTDEIISSLLPINAYQILIVSFHSVKKNFIQKKIIIKVDSAQENYFVNANELLKDVFVNILTNAIQHNNKPFVEILIKISKEKSKGIQNIKFEFIDNGIGIPDSMKELIFNREYKKEGTPSGIGLGLLLVKKILDSYKGKIRVEDRVKGDFSKGSNFILTIPEAI